MACKGTVSYKRIETLDVLHTFNQPWYQVPPIDFVTENLISREFRDERIVDFHLQPQRIVPTEETVGRAEGLRQAIQGATAAGVRPRIER